MAKKRKIRRSTIRRSAFAGSALVLAVLGSTYTAHGMVDTLLQNAGGILDGRSPGGRDAGALFQTKTARNAPGPRQRVLAGTRTRPQAALPGGVPGNPVETGPAGGGTGPADGAGSGGQPGGFGGSPVPFGTTGLTATGGQPVFVPGADVTPTPVDAVPEPDTYALMAIGIGVAGAMLRRKRRGNAPRLSGGPARLEPERSAGS